MKTLKVLSALLSYPGPGLVEAAEEMKQALRAEALLPAAQLAPVLRLIDDIAAGDFYDLQERYLLLFDRTRSLSLHLFEHVHGESRDRGQAMVDLLHRQLLRKLRLDLGQRLAPHQRLAADALLDHRVPPSPIQPRWAV